MHMTQQTAALRRLPFGGEGGGGVTGGIGIFMVVGGMTMPVLVDEGAGSRLISLLLYRTSAENRHPHAVAPVPTASSAREDLRGKSFASRSCCNFMSFRHLAVMSSAATFPAEMFSHSHTASMKSDSSPRVSSLVLLWRFVNGTMSFSASATCDIAMIAPHTRGAFCQIAHVAIAPLEAIARTESKPVTYRPRSPDNAVCIPRLL